MIPVPLSPQPVVSEAETWRPRFHYTPSQHWMNDPNGLCFFDGEYHLYYQYNPLGIDWGHISWGHAVSTDLATWQELPVAIADTDRSMAFSGSVVVDHDNAGGFALVGAAAPALVAFFTGFDPVTKIQSQHLAYSLDRGRSYTRYAGNPVIDIGSTEFRDPKVFWYAPKQRWVMLVVAALHQQVWFYTSTDLRQWDKVSTFGPAGSAAGNIWEVPELFELPVDGDAAHRRWVLVVSVNHGSLWGGSGVQYFVGDFDGECFAADPSEPANPAPGSNALPAIAHITLWADHGRDFYAPITFANLPDERVLWLGWVSNWDYARALPTPAWRGQQSGVRQLDLAATPRGTRLRQRMADEMLALVEPEACVALRAMPATRAAAGLATANVNERQCVARLSVLASSIATPIGFELFKGKAEAVKVGFDPQQNTFFVDRRTALPKFAGQSERHDAQRLLDAREITLEAWVDGSVLEVFCDDGTVVLTDLVYAEIDATGVGLFHGAENPQVERLDVHTVRSTLKAPTG